VLGTGMVGHFRWRGLAGPLPLEIHRSSAQCPALRYFRNLTPSIPALAF
jgi:hypothetical protein